MTSYMLEADARSHMLQNARSQILTSRSKLDGRFTITGAREVRWADLTHGATSYLPYADFKRTQS
jgi:hypothetical protein